MAIVLNGTTGITTPGLINSGDSTVTGNTTFSSSSYVGIGLTPTSRNNAHLQLIDGIGFPATQVSSSDANVLDDYEEGTWTGTINHAGGSYTQTGYYTKIGRLVTVSITVSYNSGAGTTNSLQNITGLPFINVGDSKPAPCGLFYSMKNAAGNVNGAYPGFIVGSNATTIALYISQNNAYETLPRFYDSNGYFSVTSTYYTS